MIFKSLKKIKKKVAKELNFNEKDFIVWTNNQKGICIQFRRYGELYGNQFIVDFKNKKLIPFLI